MRKIDAPTWRGVEAVQPPDEDGDSAQRQILEADLAQDRQGQGLGDRRFLGAARQARPRCGQEPGHQVGRPQASRLIDGGLDGPARGRFILPADDVLIADDGERHPGNISLQ